MEKYSAHAGPLESGSGGASINLPYRQHSRWIGRRDGASRGGWPLSRHFFWFTWRSLPRRGRCWVLYSNNRLLPANVAFDTGLHEAIQADPAKPVKIFSEFLDEPDFAGDRYELTVATYLREKYADQPLDAVLVASGDALKFVLRCRDRVFPRVPAIHVGVTPATLQSLGPLPPDVVGTPIAYDIAGTVEQALKWHSRATHLVIVTGRSVEDTRLKTALQAGIAPLLGRVQAEYLDGLPLPALQKRLRELGSDSVVLTGGFFRDGDGRPYTPRDTAALVAAASSAPVYTFTETFMGTGVVGGRMLSFEQIGRHTAQILERFFSGHDWNGMPAAAPSVLEVDWRQVRRWGIDPGRIPPMRWCASGRRRSGRRIAMQSSAP